MKTILIILFPVISVLACSTGPSSKMLIGKYCYSKEFYKDSIYINGDNSYRHKFTSVNGQIFESSGAWEYDSIKSEILFKDFIFFNNEGSKDSPLGNWFSKVQLFNNKEVRLIYSSDNNIYYSNKQAGQGR